MHSVLSCFALSGAPVSCEPYGSGHINGTQLVVCESGTRYILQHINTNVFREPEALMRNIELVTAHLRTKVSDPRGVLQLVPTHEGLSYAVDGGEYWRVYELVENSVCYQSADRALFYESAVAFGRFQNQLADFPATLLVETIPHFHDTPARYRALREAIAADRLGRAKECEREIAFALAREEEAGTLMRMLAAGELPLRVTHNDTKLNNVMLDAKTHEAVCVIDLDTVMPGLAANDFGDLVRFGANTGAEDEKELAKISLSLPHYEQLLAGFLGLAGTGYGRPFLDGDGRHILP